MVLPTGIFRHTTHAPDPAGSPPMTHHDPILTLKLHLVRPSNPQDLLNGAFSSHLTGQGGLKVSRPPTYCLHSAVVS